MLEGLLYPKSLAVIGASRVPGKVGYSILSNLIAAGFQGKIFPVNPTADEMLGLPCYPDVRETRQEVDHCIIVVPPKAVMAALESAAAVKAKACTVITAGFRKSARRGQGTEMLDFCRKHSIRLLGPNCLGLINTENHMNASFAAQDARRAASR